jgi:hypothetical protein
MFQSVAAEQQSKMAAAEARFQAAAKAADQGNADLLGGFADLLGGGSASTSTAGGGVGGGGGGGGTIGVPPGIQAPPPPPPARAAAVSASRSSHRSASSASGGYGALSDARAPLASGRQNTPAAPSLEDLLAGTADPPRNPAPPRLAPPPGARKAPDVNPFVRVEPGRLFYAAGGSSGGERISRDLLTGGEQLYHPGLFSRARPLRNNAHSESVDPLGALFPFGWRGRWNVKEVYTWCFLDRELYFILFWIIVLSGGALYLRLFLWFLFLSCTLF